MYRFIHMNKFLEDRKFWWKLVHVLNVTVYTFYLAQCHANHFSHLSCMAFYGIYMRTMSAVEVFVSLDKI